MLSFPAATRQSGVIAANEGRSPRRHEAACRGGHGKVVLRSTRRSRRAALVLQGIVSALVLGSWPAGGQEVVADDPLVGLDEWRKIESVLAHPRCLNCHTISDYPRQGDERQPH